MRRVDPTRHATASTARDGTTSSGRACRRRARLRSRLTWPTARCERARALERARVALSGLRSAARRRRARGRCRAPARARRPTGTRCASSSRARRARARSGGRRSPRGRAGPAPSASRRGAAGSPCGRTRQRTAPRPRRAWPRPSRRPRSAPVDATPSSGAATAPTRTRVSSPGGYMPSAVGANTRSTPAVASLRTSPSRSRG